MEHVNPTRMNLLARRGQIRLARQGADLLNRKKDALLREFFARAGKVCRLRGQLVANLRREAVEAILAEGRLGRHVLAAAATQLPIEVTIRPRNLWGVKVMELEHTYRPRDAQSRPVWRHEGELALEEIAVGFEQIVSQMLELAPQELHLRRIGEDIRRTNRRVNALQQQLIPHLEEQARHISQVLDERAREDTIRLKRLKQKKTTVPS